VSFWFTRSPVHLRCPSPPICRRFVHIYVCDVCVCVCVCACACVYVGAVSGLSTRAGLLSNSVFVCLACCAQADCLAWSPDCLPCMRQTYISHGPSFFLLTTYFYVGVMSPAKARPKARPNTAGAGGRVDSVNRRGRTWQPRAGLTNQAVPDPTREPAALSHWASLSESRVPAQLITIVDCRLSYPGGRSPNAMLQRYFSPSAQAPVCSDVLPSCVCLPFLSPNSAS
jgi:hypothetical protein